MIPLGVENLWASYLADEKVGLRQESLAALDRFIEALLSLPPEIWQRWARDLARDLVDDGEDSPVRFPLFRSVLFPALHVGLQTSVPGSARWLAGFFQLLYKSPSCLELLPDDERSEWGLIHRAMRDDPQDGRSKRRLLELMRSHFDYVLHELPAAVLCGTDSASIEGCDELLRDLGEYEQLIAEFGLEEDHDLLAEARFHIPAYRQYLTEAGLHGSYEAYLSSLRDT